MQIPPRKLCDKFCVSILFVCFLILFAGCGAKYSLPDHCDTPSPRPFPVAELLNRKSSHPCFDWIAKTYWRTGTFGFTGDLDKPVSDSFGSFVVWTTDTFYGTALAVSAAHVLKDYFGYPKGVAIPTELINPINSLGKAVLRFSDKDAGFPRSVVSPAFLLFHPEIPADESDPAAKYLIKPLHDFQVIVIDNQLLTELEEIQSVRLEPFRIFDALPLKLDASISVVRSDELVIIVGYSGINRLAPQLFAGVGRVMDRTEIKITMADLKQLGDEEAQIPYDPQAEFIIQGSTMEGMSGGGVFNKNGQLIGIIVRGTSNANLPIVRCIRMTYIVETLALNFRSADENVQKKVKPFLDRKILAKQD